MKRSGPLKRRTPLRAKRAKPRRNEGRINHARMKEKESRAPNAEERAFRSLVAGVGCLVCGLPATIHHITSDGYKRIARSHQLIAPLCPIHHQKVFDPKDAAPVSVEGLGHARFRDRHGIDLLNWASAAWERRNKPQDPFWTDGVTRLREYAKRKGRDAMLDDTRKPGL